MFCECDAFMWLFKKDIAVSVPFLELPSVFCVWERGRGRALTCRYRVGDGERRASPPARLSVPVCLSLYVFLRVRQYLALAFNTAELTLSTALHLFLLLLSSSSLSFFIPHNLCASIAISLCHVLQVVYHGTGFY